MNFVVKFAAVSALALMGSAAAASDRPVSVGPRVAGPAAAEVASVEPSLGAAEVTEAALAADGVRLGSDAVGPLPAEMGGSEVILNWDSRMVLKTTLYPNRAVGLITRNGAHHCTGWLISRNTVATAGHCVHSGRGGTWYDRRTMRFYPGRDGASSPYGSCGVSRMHSVTGWTVNGNRDYDYGAMRLDCLVGNTVGWFGMYSHTAPLNEPAIITGYPGDKPQTQWISSDKVREALTRQVRYRMDTVGGNSGSPIWSDRSAALSTTGAWGYAIHTFGDTANSRNGGTRIVSAVLTNYVNWINLP
ncbi:MAG: trypsin-like serine protease [Rhodobacteraceae bacterium]|jgi:glutamyl endopeptidase|nr:trypsin-like serine protease [Paracoccaceae bacterium]